jgi:hypothetical protein
VIHPASRKLALEVAQAVAMVDAAHEAVWFDGFWAINRRADFKKSER